MKTTLRGYAVACLTALMILGSACTNEDNTPSDKKETVDNPELLMALKTKGFKVEGSTVTLTPKELKMTELDLSGAGLKSLKGLEIFPMLTSINLENNNFGDSIDFAQLPEKITSVDLAKNKIYKWKGLIKVNFNSTDANSAFKVLRQLKSLTLPYTARYDMEALPYYFTNKGAEKMMMENKEGQVEPYTTLREIPDPALREIIKETFSSVMTDDDKIDITKKLSTDQSSADLDLLISTKDMWGYKGIKDLEGVEFIINSPFYQNKELSFSNYEDKPLIPRTIGYIKPNKHLELLTLLGLTTDHLDLSDAENLRDIRIEKDPNLEMIDMSHSKWLLQKEGASVFETRQEVIFYDCPKLKVIKLPETKTPMPLEKLYLVNLPVLEKINTDNISGLMYFNIAKVPNLKSINLEAIKGYMDKSRENRGKIITDKKPTINLQLHLGTTKETIDHVKGLREFYIRLGKKLNMFTERSNVELPAEFPSYDYYKNEINQKTYPEYSFFKEYTDNPYNEEIQ